MARPDYMSITYDMFNMSDMYKTYDISVTYWMVSVARKI